MENEDGDWPVWGSKQVKTTLPAPEMPSTVTEPSEQYSGSSKPESCKLRSVPLHQQNYNWKSSPLVRNIDDLKTFKESNIGMDVYLEALQTLIQDIPDPLLEKYEDEKKNGEIIKNSGHPATEYYFPQMKNTKPNIMENLCKEKMNPDESAATLLNKNEYPKPRDEMYKKEFNKLQKLTLAEECDEFEKREDAPLVKLSPPKNEEDQKDIDEMYETLCKRNAAEKSIGEKIDSLMKFFEDEIQEIKSEIYPASHTGSVYYDTEDVYGGDTTSMGNTTSMASPLEDYFVSTQLKEAASVLTDLKLNKTIAPKISTSTEGQFYPTVTPTNSISSPNEFTMIPQHYLQPTTFHWPPPHCNCNPASTFNAIKEDFNARMIPQTSIKSVNQHISNTPPVPMLLRNCFDEDVKPETSTTIELNNSKPSEETVIIQLPTGSVKVVQIPTNTRTINFHNIGNKITVDQGKIIFHNNEMGNPNDAINLHNMGNEITIKNGTIEFLNN